MECIKSWQLRAACFTKGVSTDTFFPEDNTGHIGKKSCKECPVKGLCMTYAIAHEEYGIWGGTYRNERDRLGSDFKESIREAYFEAGLLEYRPGLVEYFLRQKMELSQEQFDPNDVQVA
jgi:hypothetical protein